MTTARKERDWLILHDFKWAIESSAVAPVLDLLGSCTASSASCLYWIDPAACQLRLIGVSSITEDSRINPVGGFEHSRLSVYTDADITTPVRPRSSGL
jgi:hypothetical protein